MKEFTCVSCPVGCRLTAVEKNGAYTIEGYTCKRGLEYGLQEMKDPRRNISSTVCIDNGFLAVLPVKTAQPIPKGMIFQVMKEINKKKMTAPVQVGDVVIHNVLNTGVDIVATRNMTARA
ncbi:MAG: DUF1667 domain-containing protein [Treponema sp.]